MTARTYTRTHWFVDTVHQDGDQPPKTTVITFDRSPHDDKRRAQERYNLMVSDPWVGDRRTLEVSLWRVDTETTSTTESSDSELEVTVRVERRTSARVAHWVRPALVAE